VNGDNEWSEKIAVRTKAKIIHVGLGGKNDWRAKKIRLDKNGATFQVECVRKRSGTGVSPVQNTTGETPVPRPEFSGEYRINLLGRHQVTNALLAMAVGAELSLSRDEICDGLAACQPPKMRLNFWEANGVRVLDDAYNANADSTIAALETLCDLPLQGRRVAVLATWKNSARTARRRTRKSAGERRHWASASCSPSGKCRPSPRERRGTQG